LIPQRAFGPPKLSREYFFWGVVWNQKNHEPHYESHDLFSPPPSPSDVRDWVICQKINIFFGTGPKKMVPKEFEISLPGLEPH